jgi:hypothetical protein
VEPGDSVAGLGTLLGPEGMGVSLDLRPVLGPVRRTAWTG